MSVALLSAVEQRKLMLSGELSAVELLEACLVQHETLNRSLNAPSLNAVVETQIAAARQRAANADAAKAAGEDLGPLHGLPMTVKDSIDWVGMRTTWGDPQHKNYRPASSAQVLTQLLDARAVPYGKTNVPLKLGEWQTFNEIYGLTTNPWDRSRSAGGSSGGSAVAVATGMAALEVGSDIGGSIRWPAHHNGVCGLKPSFGLVSAHGHTYPGQEGTVDCNVVGPIARTVSDLELMLPIIKERFVRPLPCEKRSLSEFTVGVMLDNPVGKQDSQTQSVLRAAMEKLEAHGLRIAEPPHGDFLLRGHEVSMHLVRAASSGPFSKPFPRSEAERFDSGDRDFRAWTAKAERLSYRRWIELNNERERARLAWAAYFADVDLLLTPIAATTAPPHDTQTHFSDQEIMVDGERRSILEQWFWAGMANGMYLPGLAVPVGIAADGMPVGMQALGPFMGDYKVLRFGVLAEQILRSPLSELHKRL